MKDILEKLHNLFREEEVEEEIVEPKIKTISKINYSGVVYKLPKSVQVDISRYKNNWRGCMTEVLLKAFCDVEEE